ncbi:hypothetical protein [Romboutsia ilealis]|uniref:hypothetical protein n=1 Tax=Romboutsia ilealis TaxID=1115758 RepID=UPI00267594EB|nr:hypothetical protein [Romboutsia ilealis]
MKLSENIKFLINEDLKKGLSINNIMKKYGVKKSDIRSIEAGEVQRKGENLGQEMSITNDNKFEIDKEVIINGLIDNYDVLMEMVEQFKKTNVLPRKKILMNLPHEEDKSYKISMRVNKTVMDQFKVFCSNNKNFTQKELLSMALVEYMEKYT